VTLITNEKRNKSLAVVIFNTYQEYVGNSYPTDPAAYTIEAHPETLNKLTNYFDIGVVFGKRGNNAPAWGFQLKEDPSLKRGVIIFGPQKINIFWTEEDK
jgi:hypothetical protein